MKILKDIEEKRKELIKSLDGPFSGIDEYTIAFNSGVKAAFESKYVKALVDALETGSFHHPKCPWYNNKKCLCPNKKVKKVMEKLGDLK